jgi:hypothetical protein
VEAASAFTVFSNGGPVPRAWRADWESSSGWHDPMLGSAWPETMRLACLPKRWPKHAFGTANAPILVLLHRPGGQEDEAGGVEWIEPRYPNLGGISHAHVERYAPRYLPISKTWNPLLKHLQLGLARFALPYPLAAVMVACLIDIPSRKRVRAAQPVYDAALADGGRMDRICELIEPLVVIACGGDVHDEIDKVRWTPPNGAPVYKVEHPSYQGWGSGGPAVERLLQNWARKGTLESPRIFNKRNAERVASRSSSRS